MVRGKQRLSELFWVKSVYKKPRDSPSHPLLRSWFYAYLKISDVISVDLDFLLLGEISQMPWLNWIAAKWNKQIIEAQDEERISSDLPSFSEMTEVGFWPCMDPASLEVVKSRLDAFWTMCFHATQSARWNNVTWIAQGVGQDDSSFPWGLQSLVLLIFFVPFFVCKIDSQGILNLISLNVACFWKIWHSVMLLF